MHDALYSLFLIACFMLGELVMVLWMNWQDTGRLW